jgi:hypothetical protein
MHVEPPPQRPAVTVVQYADDVREEPNESSDEAIESLWNVTVTTFGAVTSDPPPYTTGGNGNLAAALPLLLLDDVELDELLLLDEAPVCPALPLDEPLLLDEVPVNPELPLDADGPAVAPPVPSVPPVPPPERREAPHPAPTATTPSTTTAER